MNNLPPKQKPFAVFDIDGTLIRWQLYHAVAEALAKLGHIDSSTHQTIRRARMLWKQRSHTDAFKQYEQVLVAAYDNLLGQLDAETFNSAAQSVFSEYKDQVYTYTRNLLKDLKQQGYLLFAISGSQTEIVGLIARHYGFDEFVGSTYIQKNGRYTGQKTVPIGSKHEVLKELVNKHRATIGGSLAVGDSGGDISMLAMVERPIAFNPDQTLYKTAKANGWEIVVERKNVVYRLVADKDQYFLLPD